MKSLVGFTVYKKLTQNKIAALDQTQNQALAQFGHLERRSLKIGETHLECWGHQGMSERIHSLPDGSWAILVGSPHNQVSWEDINDKLLSSDFELPWEGRVILVRISADGKHWTMRNDWLGSIPIYYANIGSGRAASTLEPVTVAAAGYTSDNFFMPGLISLLINGHFISDWTLYDGMKTVLPDSVSVWDEDGYRARQVWSVKPTQSRWETKWDDLVDEMYELSHKATADILNTQPSWILPLSSGMDSRLLAGVAADVGANVYTFAWGARETTDVIYSRQIAKTLGFPWKRIDLPKNFLANYTPHWADLFGSAMHFHGMYQMAFLDQLKNEPSGPVFSGFIGDVLAGNDVISLTEVHASKGSCQIYDDWHVHWTVNDIPSLIKLPVADAMFELASAIENQINAFSGSRFQSLLYLELWSRQRYFTYFQSTLSDYWRGVATPFLDREYARFCMSLPRAALDNRRLLMDVFRRYYGRLAVIPGTYANDPMILTGRYLINRRIAKDLPKRLRYGPFAGFENVQLRMDSEAIQFTGRNALWPLFDQMKKLAEWINVDQVERDYQVLMKSKEDILPLRRLQAVQTLAYRLL